MDSSPTAGLVRLFDAHADLDSFPAAVTAHFSHIFSNPDALQHISPLNAAHPPEAHNDRALVRFRAMVQDTSSSPEIYLAIRKGAQCGGWGLGEDDATLREEPINYAHLRECTVLWAVSVPGESSWCSAVLDAASNSQNYAPHRPPHPHKFPVPYASHIGVQIKIYDNPCAADSFKSTELHSFVGILTFEPLHADLELDTPGLVPTLHVLFSRPVPTTIVPRVYPDFPAKTIRDELIAWIAASSLAGDHDAAEWVLLSSIARVQSRTPPILPLTLTLSRFPSPADANSMPALSHVLSQIFPIVTTLPLSLNTLNTTSFAPEFKTEDLHSGWLQLPSGSVCLVTEGGVTEGGVSQRGLANLRAVQEMMNGQTLEYVFPYSRFTFNTDVTFVVLSEGKKSAFFHTNVHIPLKPAETATAFDFYKPADAITTPPQETLEMFRRLVGSAKVGAVSIGEGTAEFIQEDFVQERKGTASPSEALSSDDLIHRMMLARLLALSFQEKEITVPIWEKAKALEARRKTRIPQ
ncbi:hypothetical protein D9615_001723 [Tricholomella constricta]|uniref:Mini-chromosome maintenance complex-binding protein n=1 Tax=Tricholomella constricta TaxID=117010 RepID=A0A8H5M9T6_9AGAR|nr:hypothetical protein D9615_001723 [Tricholomella constricta]